MQSTRPLRIAFFAPSGYEYIPRLADGLLRYQADRGGCVVRDFRFDSNEFKLRDGWQTRPWPWADWQPDGLIIHNEDPALDDWVAASGLAVVNTSRRSRLPSVTISADGAARVAIEHFESLGFTRFAYVGNGTKSPRFDAFQDRLRCKGHSVSEIHFDHLQTPWSDEVESHRAGADHLCAVLRDTPKPLAVFAADDSTGRVVCRAAIKLGLKIPWQVGVLASGDSSGCRTCEPPLSSIRMRGEDVAFRAMEILVDAIHGRPAPAQTEIEPGKVHARESTIGGRNREADLAHAMQVIQEQAGSGLRAGEVLEELQMSKTTMYREFTASLGRTAAQEIARLRLERAKELLGTTRIPIARIGLMMGYPTAGNFTTFFKTQTGITPMAFRIAGRIRPVTG